jgi:ribosomal-protein-alanine N-acetyltransferase
MNANFIIGELIIETERLILRPFKKSDLQDFNEYASVPGVGEMAGWGHHETIEKTQEILDMFIREDKTFAIVLKNNNKVIGSLGVEKYGLEDKLTEFNGYYGREIGYVLSKDYWGQGIMPEAVTAVINYLFNDLNLDFLTCGYYEFNNQSKRVQEKCGFKPYRKLVMDTRLGTREPGVLNLLLNPNKNIQLVFSHPETLIYK